MLELIALDTGGDVEVKFDNLDGRVARQRMPNKSTDVQSNFVWITPDSRVR
jgi:hypothetical protein